jgi:threonine dehydratase
MPDAPQRARLVGTHSFRDIVGSAIDSGDHARDSVMASTALTITEKCYFVANFQHTHIIAGLGFIVK